MCGTSIVLMQSNFLHSLFAFVIYLFGSETSNLYISIRYTVARSASFYLHIQNFKQADLIALKQMILCLNCFFLIFFKIKKFLRKTKFNQKIVFTKKINIRAHIEHLKNFNKHVKAICVCQNIWRKNMFSTTYRGGNLHRYYKCEIIYCVCLYA